MASTESVGVRDPQTPSSTAPYVPGARGASKSNWWVWLLLLVVVAGGYWYYRGRNSQADAQRQRQRRVVILDVGSIGSGSGRILRQQWRNGESEQQARRGRRAKRHH